MSVLESAIVKHCMAPGDFAEFVRRGNAGDSIEYFRGYTLGLPKTLDTEVIDYARRCYEGGAVELFQRRYGSFDYGYIALHTGRMSRVPNKRRDK